MKQTAVEFLADKVSEIIGRIPQTVDQEKALLEALEKAKEMQDEQMQLTWNNAIDAVQKDKWESYDDFYNHNFKAE
jgi:hypothetical protein